MHQVVAPKLGLTVEHMEVVAWLRSVGDDVSAGDILLEVDADKSAVEIEAPGDGVLLEIRAEEGEEVTPGQVLGVVGPRGAVVAPEQTTELARDEGSFGPPSDGPSVVVDDRADEVRPSSPAARRLARELGVDIGGVTGSGPGGRIVESDVEAAAGAAASTARASAPAGDDRGLEEVVWTPIRRTTARRMAESARTVAPVTLHRRADATAALAEVARHRDDGLRATVTHAVLWATAAALSRHPAMNAVWDGERLMRSRRIDLGLAVDLGDGLAAPVIPGAGSLGMKELAEAAAAAVERARSGSFNEADIAGGTFTVSNLGALGVEWFTPIINPPQVGMLGLGAVVEGKVYLSLTFDHRAIDGAPAARFLAEIADLIERMDGA